MKLIPLIMAALCAFSAPASAFITIQSTTSTQSSGLYEAILPQFTAQSGVEARVVAVGTGQALRNARNCDADVLLVHARDAEEAFVAAGYGLARHDVMYNDFVILGPEGDPAGLEGAASAADALMRIMDQNAAFISRGDDSGTHKAELRLWAAASRDPSAHSGGWYRETGAGMGASLTIAQAMQAYILSDRATWLAFGNKGDMRIVFEGDPALFNQYGVIALNPAHCPNVKAEEAEMFINWLLGAAGQDAINAYKRDGAQLFYANAKR